MTHGADAVHEIIEDSGWSYPVMMSDLEREHALTNLDIDADGKSIMLGELLVDVEVDRFESQEDLEAKLKPVFEAERERRKLSFFERIKHLLLRR